MTALLAKAAIAQTIETFAGSGVLVGTRGEVLTNSHVLDRCDTITVQFPSEGPQAATLIARDTENDLAIVRVKAVPGSVAAFREGAALRAGDTVVAIGYPHSDILATTPHVSVGAVDALAGIADDARFLQISAPVQAGNSGGPLLDTSGHLVGIVNSKLDAIEVARSTGDLPQNVNFAIKAAVARAFLESRSIDYRTARSDQQLSPADVGDIARPFAAYIECQRTTLKTATGQQPRTAQPPPPPPSAKPPAFSNIPGAGQTDAAACKTISNPPELRVERCSGAIDYFHQLTQLFGSFAASQYPEIGSNPEMLFAHRASAYRELHETDKALKDLDEALRLNPKYAAAYGARCAIFRERARTLSALSGIAIKQFYSIRINILHIPPDAPLMKKREIWNQDFGTATRPFE
jgi:hypothetical protein